MKMKIRKRETARITTDAAAVVAVFAVSGKAGPSHATAYGQQVAKQRARRICDGL